MGVFDDQDLQKQIGVSLIGFIEAVVVAMIQFESPVLKYGLVFVGVVFFFGFIISAFRNLSGAKLIKGSLYQHSVFQEIESYRNWVMYEFALKDQAKTSLFRAILLEVISIYEKYIRIYIEKTEKVDSSITLFNTIGKCINDVLIRIGEYDGDKSDTKYYEDNRQAVILATQKFLKIHRYKIKPFRIAMLESAKDEVYGGPLTMRRTAILGFFYTLLLELRRDMKITIEKINGDLDGKTFNGWRIMNEEVRKQVDIDKIVRQELRKDT